MSGLRIIVRFGERKAKVDSLVAGTSDVEDVLKSIRREHLFSQINENTSLDTLSLYLDGKEQDRFHLLSENDKNKEFELKQSKLGFCSGKSFFVCLEKCCVCLMYLLSSKCTSLARYLVCIQRIIFLIFPIIQYKRPHKFLDRLSLDFRFMCSH